MGAAAGVAEDAATGVYDRLRSLPIPRSAVMVGRSLADTHAGRLGHARHRRRSASLVGFRTHGAIADGRARRSLLIARRRVRLHLGVHPIGLVSGNAQAAQGMSMLVIPFSFISSANVPVDVDAGLDAAVRRQPADHA